MNEWWQAFLLTELVEVPIYLLAARNLGIVKRISLAFGASLATHPIVWFAFPWQTANYAATFILAELFAVLVEALLAKWAGVRRALAWSFLANGASVGVGLMVRLFIDRQS